MDLATQQMASTRNHTQAPVPTSAATVGSKSGAEGKIEPNYGCQWLQGSPQGSPSPAAPAELDW